MTRLAAMRDLVRNGTPPAQAATLIIPGPVTRSQLAALAGRLRAAADVMNGGYIAAIVQAALLRYGTMLAWKEIITPALVETGKRWEREGDGVCREHVLSGTIDAVLRAYAHSTLSAAPGGPPVLLLAALGERHTLPLTALTAALAERGTAAVPLAESPAADLPDTLARLQPRKAMLWARSRETASLATLGALVRDGRRVYAAGPGWDAASLPDGIRHVATMAAALRVLAPDTRRRTGEGPAGRRPGGQGLGADAVGQLGQPGGERLGAVEALVGQLQQAGIGLGTVVDHEGVAAGRLHGPQGGDVAQVVAGVGGRGQLLGVQQAGDGRPFVHVDRRPQLFDQFARFQPQATVCSNLRRDPAYLVSRGRLIGRLPPMHGHRDRLFLNTDTGGAGELVAKSMARLANRAHPFLRVLINLADAIHESLDTVGPQ
jgi:hypothetical protein